MPSFEELVAKIAKGPEAIGDVEAFTAELDAAYRSDMTQLAAEKESFATKIGALEADLSKRDDTIKELKLTNYDLITTKGVNGGDGKPEPIDEPQQQGINALFKAKE